VRARRLAALTVAALAAVACGSATPGPRAAASCTVAGDHRFGTALLHVPPRPAKARPLVLGLHGAGGTGPGFADFSGLSKRADEAGFAVLYPTAGATRRFWSLNRRSRPDDVTSVAALLDQVIASACVDARRVYATGVSNGGGFAARMGCELAGRLAAVAPVAGGYRSLDPCPAGRRTSLLEIHGSADPVVPYRGRGARREGDVRRFVAQWARRDGCRAAPLVSRPRRDVQRVRHPGCAAGLEVEHLRLEGEGHGWYPGTAERVWRFFAGKRLR
jgi:polyhydroxybutyrate depolymerase